MKRSWQEDDIFQDFLKAHIVNSDSDVIQQFKAFCHSLLVQDDQLQHVFYDFYPKHNDANVTFCLYEVLNEYIIRNMPYGKVKICTSEQCFESISPDVRVVIADHHCVNANTLALVQNIRHIMIIECDSDKYAMRYKPIKDMHQFDSVVIDELFTWIA